MVPLDGAKMKRSLQRLRKSFMTRGARYVVAVALILGVVMLYLLSTASTNTTCRSVRTMASV